MSSVESIGPCGVCAYTAQPGPPPNSSFQRPRLPNLSFLKSSKTRSGPDGSTTSFQSSICKTCQKICRDSSWISGTVSSIQRDGEIIPVPGGLERLRTSAEEGCHMCTLLYGFFSDEWLADIERRGATGADGDRVCLHIWEASATLISIKPCAGGLTYDKDKGQTDNTYSLSVSPVPSMCLFVYVYFFKVKGVILIERQILTQLHKAKCLLMPSQLHGPALKKAFLFSFIGCRNA